MAEIFSLFQMDVPDVENIMRAADTNRDGQLDYSEFITAAFDKQMLLSEANINRAFKMLDINGDGKIDRSELIQVFNNGAGGEPQDEKFWDEII